MDTISQNPFFWALISLFGILGATAAVNTKYGRRFRWFGATFAFLFTIGRFILVLPFIPQPRFHPSAWINITGILAGLVSLTFILPNFKNQPLIFSQQNAKLRTSGLNGIVRHPFYLGELLFTTAISLLFHSIIGLALIPIWWAAFILHIVHEEERLELELGPVYLEYKMHVKGRIIPIPPFELSPAIPLYPFQNLVFKGGGIKGVAYLGAIRALEEFGLLSQVKRVAGSSAGAITATLLAFNKDVNYTIGIMETLNYQMVPQLKSELETREPDWLPRFIGKEVTKLSADVEAIQRLITKYGWYASEYFFEWLKEVIASNCNGNPLASFADFKELGYKDLYIIGTNASKLKYTIYSYEHTPTVPVALAVRISMSIPLFFETVQFDGKQAGKGDYHVDGGVLLNFPLHIFDEPGYSIKKFWFKGGINWETLGFYLYADPDMNAASEGIHGFRDFISRLYEAYDLSNQIIQIDNNQIDSRRTVKINTANVHATDFYIKPGDEKHQYLLDEGYEATIRFLKDYQHPSIMVNW